MYKDLFPIGSVVKTKGAQRQLMNNHRLYCLMKMRMLAQNNEAMNECVNTMAQLIEID